MSIIPIYFHREIGIACPHLIDINPPTQLVAQLEIRIILKYAPWLSDSNLAYIPPRVYPGLQLLSLLHGTPEHLRICNPCVDLISFAYDKIYSL